MAKIKRGFTLIEILTVSVIMVLFSISLVAIFLSTFRGGTKAQVLQQIHQDGDFALKAITREVRRAKTIDCTAANILTLTTTYDVTPIVYQLDIDSNRLASVSGSITSYLTGTLGEVSPLSFECITVPSGGQIVTISFTITKTGTQNQEILTQTFSTSVATRQQ